MDYRRTGQNKPIIMTTMTTTTTTTSMASSSSSQTVGVYSKKRLEGIQMNTNLAKCWTEAVQMADDYYNKTKKNHFNDSDLSSFPMTLEEAIHILLKSNDDNCVDRKKTIPFSVLQAIQIVYQELAPDDPSKVVSLEKSLQRSALIFTTSSSTDHTSSLPGATAAEKTKFQKRLDRLRLKVEETKYHKLTGNLQDNRQDDDITAKSMTFAASVGLNMIVAPLSFGCFMYFFAGGVLDYMFPSDTTDDGRLHRNNSKGPTDIKRVIIGVISGVIMLIIEMLLFVIRTHEFEEHNRKKKQKRGVEPFGVYSKNTPAIYSDRSSSSTNEVERQEQDRVQKRD
jgi:hypothetical protein